MKRKMNDDCRTTNMKRSSNNIHPQMTPIQNILSNHQYINSSSLAESISLPNSNDKQSSTFKLHIPESMLPTILQFEFDQIFNYLLSTDTAFERNFNIFMSDNIDFIKLRTVTILSYIIRSLEIIQSLWITYRKSAAGDLPLLLEIQNVDRTVIPQQIVTFVEHQQQQPKNSNIYLNFIDACLHAIRNKHRKYQHELIDEIFQISEYNEKVQDQIKLFIQQESMRLQIEISYQIELVHFAYREEIYKRQCFVQFHHQQQTMDLVEQLCQLHYKAKFIQSNINLWKLFMSLYQRKDPSNIERFTTETFLNNVQNLSLQKDLCQQYNLAIQNLQMDTFNLHIHLIEQKQQVYQTNFHNTRHKLSNPTTNLVPSMKDTIYQRIKNITEHIKCIQSYRYRIIYLQT